MKRRARGATNGACSVSSDTADFHESVTVHAGSLCLSVLPVRFERVLQQCAQQCARCVLSRVLAGARCPCYGTSTKLQCVLVRGCSHAWLLYLYDSGSANCQGWCEWHSSSRARPLDGDPSLVIADGSLNYRALLQHPSGIVGRCMHRFGALSSDHARCGGVSGDMCSLRRGGAVPRSVLPTRGARQRMHA